MKKLVLVALLATAIASMVYAGELISGQFTRNFTLADSTSLKADTFTTNAVSLARIMPVAKRYYRYIGFREFDTIFTADSLWAVWQYGPTASGPWFAIDSVKYSFSTTWPKDTIVQVTAPLYCDSVGSSAAINVKGEWLRIRLRNYVQHSAGDTSKTYFKNPFGFKVEGYINRVY